MNPLVLSAWLLLAIGYVLAGSDCCYKKTLGGTEYTLLETGSSEVSQYGCNTAGNCIYQSPAGDRFCFKMGGADVPTCGCSDVLLVRPLSTAVEIWSPNAAACTTATLPDLPLEVRDGLRGAFVNGNMVYICCGGGQKESCYTLDMDKPDNWTKTDFAHGTKFHSLTKVNHNGNVLIASGGYNSIQDALSDQMVIMNKNGGWDTFRNYKLKSAMQKHCEVSNANGTHIWVIGGQTESQANGINTVSKLDLQANKWEDAADFPKNVFDAACVYDHSQDKIYVAAGKDFYALRVADNAWDTLTGVPDDIKGGGYSMAMVNGKVTLFGGNDGVQGPSMSVSSTVHVYDMGSWKAIDTLDKGMMNNGIAIKLTP